MKASKLVVSPHVRAIPSPPIDKIHGRVNELRRLGRPPINLGQAVPGFPPAVEILNRVRSVLHEDWVHLYGPDPGLPALREAIAACQEKGYLGRDILGSGYSLSLSIVE